MSQIHSRTVDLKTLVSRSDAILCVRKTSEHFTSTKVFIDKKHEHPPYIRNFSNFVVLDLIFDSKGKIKTGDTISVVSAYDELFLDLHKKRHLEGLSKSPIIEEYDCGEPYGEMDTMIVFLMYNDSKDMAYTVAGAYEKMSELEKIAKIIREVKGQNGYLCPFGPSNPRTLKPSAQADGVWLI